jgi:hypothetical protein|tara:strand:+ start:11516 stop:11791 length:276 start_codon:yes stop_codon:yes gene_type:complete
MKKILDFIKKVYNTIKKWIVLNGIEGVVGLIAGLILWVFGFKIYAGFAFGVFATVNWNLFKTKVLKLKYRLEKIKNRLEKIEDKLAKFFKK